MTVGGRSEVWPKSHLFGKGPFLAKSTSKIVTTKIGCVERFVTLLDPNSLDIMKETPLTSMAIDH